MSPQLNLHLPTPSHNACLETPKLRVVSPCPLRRPLSVPCTTLPLILLRESDLLIHLLALRKLLLIGAIGPIEGRTTAGISDAIGGIIVGAVGAQQVDAVIVGPVIAFSLVTTLRINPPKLAILRCTLNRIRQRTLCLSLKSPLLPILNKVGRCRTPPRLGRQFPSTDVPTL